MLELGDATAELHARVLRETVDRNIDVIVATGAFADAALVAGLRDERFIVGADWQSAYPSLLERLDGREIILLKASRGIALENLLTRLEADFGSPVDGMEA